MQDDVVRQYCMVNMVFLDSSMVLYTYKPPCGVS